MRSATIDELSNIPNIGEVKAASFVDGLVLHESLIDKLLTNGIHIKTQANGALKGMSFCFTGIRDPALETAIEQAGGTIKSSVSKGLTYLVVKDTSITTTKTQTAQKIGCKIISIQDARVMI
jgi:DNA ligase (NAD+)